MERRIALRRRIADRKLLRRFVRAFGRREPLEKTRNA
jgi:hypothetical protein